MGELSESGHLRSENAEHAVALLKRAKLPGFVFPARNGWVSFVYPPGDEARFDLAQANEKLLVLYEFEADYGCSVSVYQGKKPVARSKATFDRPSAAFDGRAFEALELLTPASAAAVAEWIKRAHLLHERARAPHFIAERLHLPRHAWFSFLAEQTNAQPDAHRVVVLANGTVKRPPKPVAPHVAPPSAAPTKKPKAPKKKTAKKPAAPKKASTKKKATKK